MMQVLDSNSDSFVNKDGKGRERAIASECFARASRRAPATNAQAPGGNDIVAGRSGGGGHGRHSARANDGGGAARWSLPQLRRPSDVNTFNRGGRTGGLSQQQHQHHTHDHDLDPDDLCIPARRAGFGVGWKTIATYTGMCTHFARRQSACVVSGVYFS